MSQNEIILITGTSRGIGRYLAEHYVRRGCHVVGCSRTPVDWSVDGYTHVEADVSCEADVKRLISAIQKAWGRLDVAINNAGIAAMNHALLTPGPTLDRVMAINFRGTALICREAAKLMMRRKYGRIVNFSTVAVPLQLEGEALYAASKSAITTYTKVLARELGPFGITCNVVGPSPIDTDLIRSVPTDKIQRIVDSLAIKRLGTFEDVVNVIDFFIRPESGYVTGQVIYLGGV